jgi:hypothetical protein
MKTKNSSGETIFAAGFCGIPKIGVTNVANKNNSVDTKLSPLPNLHNTINGSSWKVPPH